MPLINYAGWPALVGGAIYLYQRAFDRDARWPSEVGRLPVLVLLPYYLAAVAWTVKDRRFRHLVYSAAFPAVVLAGTPRRG